MKEQLFTTLIRPVILYGSKTWPLKKKDENKFIDFDREKLRKMYSPVKDSITEEWRRKKIIELDAFYSSSDILKVIRREKQRFAWRNPKPMLRAAIKQNPVE